MEFGKGKPTAYHHQHASLALQCQQMNPHPAPKVPGKTEWERFNAVRKAFSVPSEAIQREKERMEAERKAKKNRAKKA